MKRIIALLTTIFALCCVFVGCGGGSNVKVSLDKTSISIEGSGNVEKITATVENSDQTVVWSSSDTSIITVAEDTNTDLYDCIITAVAPGSATVTAKVGDATATCQVEVHGAQYYPVLTLDKTSTEIWQGDNVTVKATVTVGGEEYTGTTIAWESSNTQVATVSNGVITGVSIGESVITASTTVDGRFIDATVQVVVKDNVYFAIDETDIDLAMTAGINAGEIAEKALTITLLDKEVEQTIDGVSWTSSDDEIVTVSQNGVISSGTKVGTATITATYTYDNKVRTATMTANTYKSIVEVADDMGDVDLSEDNVSFALSEINMSGYTGMVKYGVGEIDKTGSVESDAICMPTDGLPFGVQTLSIELSDRIFTREGLFVTKILKTASDVANITAFAGGRDAETDAYDGYFILGNNIDLGSTEIKAPIDKETSRKSTTGFQGTFDGRGFILANGKYNSNGGLFGTIGENGLVKNLSIINAVFGAGDSSGSGLFAQKIFGTLDNISITATLTGGSVSNGALCYASVGATYRNIVVSLSYASTRALDSAARTNNAALAVYLPDEESVFNNIYVVTDMVYGGKVALFDVNTSNRCLYREQGRGILSAPFGSENTLEFAELSTSVWTVPTSGVPYFTRETGFVANYKVSHYTEKQSQADSYELNSTSVIKTAIGSNAVATAKNINGYAIDTTVTGTVANATVQANGSTELKLYYRYLESVTVANSDNANVVIGDASGSEAMFIRNVGSFQGKSNVYRFLSQNTTTYWERRAELMGVSNAWLFEKGYTELVFDFFFPSGNDAYMSAYTFDNGNVVNKQISGLSNAQVKGVKDYIQFYKDGVQTYSIASNTWYEVHVQFVDFGVGTLNRLFFIATAKASDGYMYIANARLAKTQFEGYFVGLDTEFDIMVGDTEEISIDKIVTGWGGKTGNVSLVSFDSASESVATVSADGVITAVGKGQTTITVSYGSGSSLIEETINVSVKDKVLMNINETGVVLTGVIKQPTDISSKQLTVSLNVNGQEYGSTPVFSWESSDSDIVAVSSNGVVTAGSKAGVATITVTWSELGQDYTATVTVENVKPEKTAQALGDVDTSKTLSLSLTDDLGLSSSEAQSITTAPIVTIGDVELQATVDGGVVNVTFVNGVPVGNQTMVIDCENFVVIVDGLFITKVITTATDLLELQTLAGGRDSETDAYNGYFVLGNSIDLGSTTVSATVDNNAHQRDNARGFQGTFDGRGHVIANGIYDHGGLFGSVGKNGVVKNVAIYNAVLKVSTEISGIVANKFFGTLENVYVDCSMTSIKNNVGAVAYAVYGATFKNVVVETEYIWNRMGALADHGAFVAFNASSGHGSSATGLSNTYENVYVITNKNYKGEVSIFNGTNTQNVTEVGNGLKKYLAGATDMSFSGLDSNYWTNEGIPYFKTIDTELTATYTITHYVRNAGSTAWVARDTETKRAIAGSVITSFGKGYEDKKLADQGNTNDVNMIPSGKASAYTGTVTAENTLALECYYKQRDQYIVYGDSSANNYYVLDMRGNPRDGSSVIDYYGTFEGVNNVWQMTSAAGGNSRIVLKNTSISLSALQQFTYFDIKVYSSNWSTIDVIPTPSSGSAYNVSNLVNDTCVALYDVTGTTKLTSVPTSGWATIRFTTSTLGNATYLLQIGLKGAGTTYYFAQPTLVKSI